MNGNVQTKLILTEHDFTFAFPTFADFSYGTTPIKQTFCSVIGVGTQWSVSTA